MCTVSGIGRGPKGKQQAFSRICNGALFLLLRGGLCILSLCCLCVLVLAEDPCKMKAECLTFLLISHAQLKADAIHFSYFASFKAEALSVQILGRADKAINFIRRGQEEALTEVTLSAGPGKYPLVIQRRLTKDNLSKYRVNGAHHACALLGSAALRQGKGAHDRKVLLAVQGLRRGGRTWSI